MIQAAIASIRHILQQDIDAAAAFEAEEAEREYPPDYGGNQDDAYAAGERAGRVLGRDALARIVLGMLPEPREEHGVADHASITVKRTGNARAFRGPVSNEFLVTYPNGHQETIWSPPWNDYEPETETAGALKAAGERWFTLCEAWQREVEKTEEARWRAENARKEQGQ